MTDKEFRDALSRAPGRPLDDAPVPGLPSDPADVTALLWRLQAEMEARSGVEGIAESKRLAHEHLAGQTGPWDD